MGVLQFQLPANLEESVRRDLEQAYFFSGSDGMPWPTKAELSSEELTLRCPFDESACVAVPWPRNGANGAGTLLTTTTLPWRLSPFRLLVELARGKVSQLRNQVAEWQVAGLELAEEHVQNLKNLSAAFARIASLQDQPAEAESLAAETLPSALGACESLARFFAQQLLRLRHTRETRLDTELACRVTGDVPSAEQTDLLRRTFTSIRLPFTWSAIEPQSDIYRWDDPDALLKWAKAKGMPVTGGPLIDFSRAALPDWLGPWKNDLQSVANFMTSHVEEILERYGKDVRVWQLTAGTNLPDVLPYADEQRLWLTAKVLQAAQKKDRELQLSIGVAQPWGEYVAYRGQTHSPLLCADMLIRAGLGVSAIGLEILMGIGPRGSHRRDLLDLSKLLDGYAILGSPLHVTFGREASPDEQAQWAEDVAAIALSKPFVKTVEWVQWADTDKPFPGCGLLDSEGKPKPVLESLRRLRESHL